MKKEKLMENRMVRALLTFSKHQHAKMKRYSSENDIPMTQMARDALKEYMERGPRKA